MLSLVLLVAGLQTAAPAAPAAPPTLSPAPAYRTVPASPAYRVAPGALEAGENAAAPSLPTPELARTGVTIEAYDRRVEGRWGADDPYYAGTIRGGAAIAQSRQGPLDGGWTLAAADGSALFALQLADTGEGGVEGAWRTAGAGTGQSGFIAWITREPGRAVLRFLEPGASAPTVVSVAPALDGIWRGEITRGAGAPAPVTMRRSEVPAARTP